MPYKDLEHDGGEDFLKSKTIENRSEVKERKERRKKEEPDKEEVFERLNRLWLNPENPSLWEGEI